MEHFVYMALIIFIGLPFIFKSHDPALPLHRRRGVALLATGIVAVPFLVWDVVVTDAGHWSFSSKYILGPKLLNLPIEEVLFFLVVPLAAILVWDTVGWVLRK